MAFPINLAIEIVRENTIYTNAMPAWFAPRQGISVAAIDQLIEQHLKGDASSSKPFVVTMPSRVDGKSRKWVLASVQDQIVLQACVSALAPELDKSLDERVYSYRYRVDPQQPSVFTQDRCSEYVGFKDASIRQSTSCKHVLFFDIEQAYASIQLDDFLKFVSAHTTNIAAVKVLEVFLRHYAAATVGLPLMNDSLFFLGNAYLSVVDNIVRDATRDYIRFVDDYCVFGSSEAELSKIFQKINANLAQSGLKINDRKTKLISAQRYMDQCREAKSQKVTANVGPPSVTVARDLMSPEDLLDLVTHTINDPIQYLNDGFGRLQLMSLGRMRDSMPAWTEEFQKGLTKSAALLQASLALLDSYAKTANETWRSVWLLYLLKSADPDLLANSPLRQKLDQTLESLAGSNTVSPVVRLWAKSHVEKLDDPALLSKLYDSGYLEQGYLYHGEKI